MIYSLETCAEVQRNDGMAVAYDMLERSAIIGKSRAAAFVRMGKFA